MIHFETLGTLIRSILEINTVYTGLCIFAKEREKGFGVFNVNLPSAYRKRYSFVGLTFGIKNRAEASFNNKATGKGYRVISLFHGMKFELVWSKAVDKYGAMGGTQKFHQEEITSRSF